MLPNAFISHYIKILGEEKAKKFFEYCKKPLRKSIRINTLKWNIKKFNIFAKENNWEYTQIPWCDTGFFIERGESPTPLGNILEHAIGNFYVQEASSMIPVEALFWKKENKKFTGKIVADIAASPGSKTTHIACKMQGNGTLLANELSSSRLKALYSNLERCGVHNCILTHYDGENLCSLLPEMFDYILLDAPCTGEGTVRKNYDAIKNWSAEDAQRMSIIQKKLIISAFQSLKEGGEMVYSTCTLGKEENQEVVEYLQKIYPDNAEIIPLLGLFEGSEKAITPEGFLHVFPEIYDTEGFFVAKIQKKKSCFQKNTTPPLKNFPFQPLSEKEKNSLYKIFETHWGFSLQTKGTLWKRDEEIWLFPENIIKIASRIRCNRSGILLGTFHSGKWKTNFESISAFGEFFTNHVFQISREECISIFSGQNIEKQGNPSEEWIGKYYKNAICGGKIISGTWKNGLPRSLIRNVV